MADELAAAEAEPGSEIAPEEDANKQEELQPDPIEEFAKTELGWAPQAEFRGDPADWKPAAEFIKAGRDIQRSLSRELRGVREEVTRIARTSAQMTADRVAEVEDHWQLVHAKAVEDGDALAAKRAVDEIVKIKAAPAADPAPPPETTDFIERHKAWFGVDRRATARAKKLADELAAEGLTPAEQLEEVEATIKRERPELFPAPAKRPASTQTATARSTDTGGRKKGFADMPAASQDMARDYLKRHGIPLEKTAESYWGDPSNQERKVG